MSERAVIEVCNLYCNNCAIILKQELSQIEDIYNIHLSLKDASVSFFFSRAHHISMVENCLTSLGFILKYDKLSTANK